MAPLLVLGLVFSAFCATVSAQTSTCTARITGTTGGTVASAAVDCTGSTVTITGSGALTRFAAGFTGVKFTADPGAGALLQIADQQVAFQDCAFSNLSPASLSVISLVGGTYSFTDCIISGNKAVGSSAVVAINSSTVAVTRSNFTNNSVDQYGGAMFLNEGSLEVSSSTFSNNAAGLSGGAIAMVGPSASSLSTLNSNFVSNTAGCKGGHLYTSYVDTVNGTGTSFEQGTVTESLSGSNAGGICATVARYTLTTGGGVSVEQFTSSSWNTCTFAGNGGSGAGAAMFLFTGLVVRVRGCTFSRNTQTAGQGSALLIVAVQNTADVRATTFSHNSGQVNGALCFQQTPTVVAAGNTLTANEVVASQSSNVPGEGGAVAVLASCQNNCVLRDNMIIANTASGDGGGIYAAAPGFMTLINNTFNSNTAGFTGGGLSVVSNGQQSAVTSLNVTGNMFVNNTVTGNPGVGGAILLQNVQSSVVNANQFTGNNAVNQGGGLWLSTTSTSSFAMDSNLFTANIAGASGGGAYLYQTQNISVTRCNFTENRSLTLDGGGLYSLAAQLFQTSGNRFVGNAAATSGGAWSARRVQNLDFANAVFINNTVQSGGNGGAIAVADFEGVTMTSCEFVGNLAGNIQAVNTTGQGASSANSVAGAAGFTNGVIVDIVNSTFMGNSAASSGGAVNADNLTDTFTASGSTFDNNAAASDGGAIALSGLPAANLTGCILTSNQAGGAGGSWRLDNLTSTALASASTFRSNSAEERGGGIALMSSPTATLTIATSSLASNQAPQGSAVYADSGSKVVSTSASVTSNSVACNSCSFRAPGATSFATISSGAGSSGGGGGGLSAGGIAGVVIGMLLALVVIGALVAVFLVRRKRRRAAKDIELAQPTKPPVTSAQNRLPPVKSAFSDVGSGSFWSEQRTTNGFGSNNSTLEGLDSDVILAGSTASFGASTVNSRRPLLDTNTGLTYNSDAMSQMTDNTNTPFPNVPWSDWQIEAGDIAIVKRDNGQDWLLGGGAFGQVYKAMLKGVIPVAVKVLKDQSYTSREEFQREVALLKALHNSNIVQFQGACLEDDKMLLVTEFMDGGDLHKAIAKRQVSWHRRGRDVAVDVLRGLHFLHSKRIVHMDLKSPNILLSRHGQAKLADVGLAKVIRDRNYITQVSVIGTFAWAAPEVLTNERCTEKADMFSFGIVLWEIVTGEAPVRGGRRDIRVPEECPQGVADLIEACLVTDPAQRPTAQEALDIIMKLPDDD